MRVEKWIPVFRNKYDKNGNPLKDEAGYVFSNQVPQYQYKVKGNKDLNSTAFRGGKREGEREEGAIVGV